MRGWWWWVRRCGSVVVVSSIVVFEVEVEGWVGGVVDLVV